jgi:hypothetical protein
MKHIKLNNPIYQGMKHIKLNNPTIYHNIPQTWPFNTLPVLKMDGTHPWKGMTGLDNLHFLMIRNHEAS